MCSMIQNGEVRLPDEVFKPLDDHYARRELYRSPEHGYSVEAMTWAPGQLTPIHDHCGLWCVEGVWDGELEITQYELLERDGERFRFRAAGGMHAGPGSAGSLIPPHEYHTITNASGAKLALRSEERRVGKESVSPCRSRLAPNHQQNKRKGIT